MELEIKGNNELLEEVRQGEVYEDGMPVKGNGRGLFYIESYGCQMNFSDSEIIASILKDNGWQATDDFMNSDLIFMNTCAIRDNAEQRVRARLAEVQKVKKKKPGALIGVLGCMAERLKEKFLEEEQMIDMVVGPDAYRSLPDLITQAESGQKAVNVLLSREETYADISPVRLDSNGVSAYISIMRGCDNMCSFCVVPFTRGRERSRDVESIIKEAQDLVDKGYKEVTLLGQNVDSYLWFGGGLKKDFEKLDEAKKAQAINFAQLLEKVALVSPDLRVRFSTSHPKDITDDVLYTIAKYENICNYIHLPLQSGSSSMLKRMNRTYDREWYMERVSKIREIIPDCAISADVITGFCGETEEEHQETLSAMREVRYDMSYMFFYSERPGTLAEKTMKDDIPEELKKARLTEVVKLQRQHSLERFQEDVGKTFRVLVEGDSKRSEDRLAGRNDQNKMIVFDKKEGRDVKKGDYVHVKVEECTSGTLMGSLVE